MLPPLRSLLLVALLTLLYGCWHLTWYLTTPLGQTPVLDERENMQLALQIAAGELPAEPFYRAMGYPLLLAALTTMGIPAENLFAAGLLLGVIFHTVSAGLAAHSAANLFSSNKAGIVAGLLYGLNPVLLHFATNLQDATFANTLFLAGLTSLLVARSEPSGSTLIATSVGWGAACVTRPNFLLLWLALPILWRLLHGRMAWKAVAAAMACGSVFVIGQGFWQHRVSGTFRLQPSQGPYNLWVANKPGAHGRYFVQTQRQGGGGSDGAHRNPTEVESTLLYIAETGQAAGSIDEVNAHWSQRFRDHLWHQPVAFARTLLRKAYYLLNNFEQYNNKTYRFHQQRSPALRYNPLNWGLLLMCAVPAVWWLTRHLPRQAGTLLVTALIYAGSVLLFFVSARFRLPLVALLCIATGGTASVAGPLWREFSMRRRAALLLVMVGLAGLTFSRFAGVHDLRPIVQDHLLLARAAQTVGDDRQSWQHAQAALALDPTRRDAASLALTAGFNLLIVDLASPTERKRWRELATAFLNHGDAHDDPAAFLVATVAADPSARTAAATARLTQLATPDALAVLVLCGKATLDQQTRLNAFPLDSGGVLFQMARQLTTPQSFSTWAETAQPPGWPATLKGFRQRLFHE